MVCGESLRGRRGHGEGVLGGEQHHTILIPVTTDSSDTGLDRTTLPDRPPHDRVTNGPPKPPSLRRCAAMWRKRSLKVVAPVLAVAAVAGVGLWLHSVDRTASDTWHSVGTEEADRIDVNASVQRVDAVGREVVLRILVVPRGRYGEYDGVAPTVDIRLLNSSSLRGDQLFPAHQRISS